MVNIMKQMTGMEWIEFLGKQSPTELRTKVDDILLAVSWREIARDYMKKPASWLHEKIDGYLRNGTPVMPMSNDETKMLKDGLLDLSERIKKVANSL
jgi:hypothetical protein